MPSPQLPHIAILGPGRLGSAFGAALPPLGYDVHLASARDVAAAQLAADRADLVFITTADAAVSSTCAHLRWRPGQSAIHCSGVLTLDALETAAASRARVGCLHPLQSFPNGAADASKFRGITFGVEAVPPLDATLKSVASALGATTVSLLGVDRALYHAAAILASNDFVALIAAATRTWSLAGLPAETARTALGPLLLNVATNVATHDLIDALTGPLARGDVATVERHLAALEVDPSLRELYRLLAKELQRLPLQHSPDVSERLRALLT